MRDDAREKEVQQVAFNLWCDIKMHGSPTAGHHLGERTYGVTFWDGSEPYILGKLADRLRKPPGGAAGSVYGTLLHRHAEAARKDFDGPDRLRIHAAIEMLEAEFPAACKAWSDYWSSPRNQNNDIRYSLD